MEKEERFAVIFSHSPDSSYYNFKTVALVDYDKSDGEFTVKNGEFEKSNERAFNRIKGSDDFIYGNSNDMKISSNDSYYSIYIFDNDFVKKVSEEKKIDKINTYVYLAKKLTKIELKENNNSLISDGSVISVKGFDESRSYGAYEICRMLYDSMDDEVVTVEEDFFDNSDENKEQEEIVFDINSVIADLNNKIIGQEQAIKTLVTNIYYNQLLIDSFLDNEDFELSEFDSRKVSILLDGATGTGKTAILKDIALNLDLPMEIVNANSFSETGYVGPTITDILYKLFVQADGDLEIAERGIVVLDEIDKIASNTSYSGKDMKRGVQEELLSFISGGIYDLEVDGFPMPIPFDTSFLTFIMSGAFTGIRDKKIKENKSNSIGFNLNNDQSNGTYEVTAQDYIDYGLMREFFGRIKIIVSTNSYSVEDLKKILLNSKISPLHNFARTVNMFGYKSLKTNEEFINKLAEEAYKMNTGARGLQTLMSEIQNEMLFDLVNGNLDPEKPVELTTESLDKPKKQRIRKI